MGKYDKLAINPRQQKTANYYLSGLSMRASMIKAGYSDQYADSHCTTMLKNKKLIAYIRERQKQEADAALADAIYVRKKLMELVETNDPSLMIDAIKLLDSHLKWNEELAAKIESHEKDKDAKDVNININYGEH